MSTPRDCSGDPMGLGTVSACAITEAAQDQTRHAPLPADLRHRRAFHLGRVGFELFA